MAHEVAPQKADQGLSMELRHPIHRIQELCLLALVGMRKAMIPR